MAALALLCLLVPVCAAAAVPAFFTHFPADGLSGEAAGRLNLPSGIAVQPSPPGNLYVADWGADRVDEFSPWGLFVRAFGWGVDAEAPEEKLQACTAQTGCRSGLPGSGTGQFDRPASIALDSTGNVYVVDKTNARVQKFDTEGHLLLGFGWGVRDGKEEAQTCGPAASPPSAECLIGKPGGGEGQIGVSDSAGRLAIGPDDTVFLADGKRIEKFSSAGVYEEQIEMPAGVRVIVVDGKGKLYAGFGSGEEVNVIRKLEPSGPIAQFIEPKFETESHFGPGGITLDGGGHLYVTLSAQDLGLPSEQPGRVLEFDPEGRCLDCGEEGEGGATGFDRSKGSGIEGIATGSACGPTDVYVSHFEPGAGGASYIKIFGEHPDVAKCLPPKVSPSIEASYAASVESSEAELRAQINPHFWPDTTYYLEYGTAPCSEGGCDEDVPAAPGRPLSEAVTNEALTASVHLEGLVPATAYYYRFVARTDFGAGEVAEVRGVGGEVGKDGEEGVFRTFAAPAAPGGCPNDAYRAGPATHLPDCRAYELVSPLDKNNGDVLAAYAFSQTGSPSGDAHEVRAGLEESSLSGDRLAYSSATAFAGALSAPYTSQYIAQRVAGSDWQTHAISPPRGRLLGREETPGLLAKDTEFKIFSPDLCDAWLRTMTDLPLAAAAVPDSFDLYRREDRLCAPGGEDGYEALTASGPAGGRIVTPPGLGITGPAELPYGIFGFALEPQGVSADGQTAIYAARGMLSPDTRTPGSELQCAPGKAADAISYQWLRDGVPITAATKSTYTTTPADAGKAIQCQVTGINKEGGAEAGSTQESGPFPVSPDPATALPHPPVGIAAPAPSAPLEVGGPGGQALSCDPEAARWGGSPSFSYQWYRNGTEIAGATEPTYTVSATDLATLAAFQCAVTGANAGAVVVEASANLLNAASSAKPEAPTLTPSITQEYRLYVRGSGGQTRSPCVMPGGGAVSCLAGTRVGNQKIFDYWSSLAGALSADGHRVFWSTPPRELPEGGGAIYERENPLAPPSAHLLGEAQGTGDLAGPVQATGNLSSASFQVKKVKVGGGGEFVVGQELSAPEGIAAGTKITKIEEPEAHVFTLTLSAKPTKVLAPATIEGVASEVLRNAKASSGAFAVGQEIEAEGGGLPAGTKIAAIEEPEAGVFTLTLSAKPTRGAPGAPFASTSRCKEADKACTVPVSAAGEAMTGAQRSRFLAASPDGDKALYIAKGEAGASDLYEFDLATEASHKIASEVPGIMGASEGLGVVYFVSQEEPSKKELAEGAQKGAPNLYRYESAGGGTYRFIAALASADAKAPAVEEARATPVALAPVSHLARVSADGSHLAFASVASPAYYDESVGSTTRYDNVDQSTGKPDSEVYLYDAGANGGKGELLCASCNPSGARPRGGEEFRRQVAATIPGWENSFYASRVLSTNGRRLFFESFDPLVPRDTNGRKDVYEWEAPGEGRCSAASPDYSPANGGCVELISSGTSPRDSEFRDASPDGRDVFFATASSLLPQDYGLIDIYDARAEGGLPVPQGPPAPCEGEACQSPSGPPAAQTPASAAFRGPGNLAGAPPGAGRCPKGKHEVRRHHRKARCAKRHTHKRRATR